MNWRREFPAFAAEREKNPTPVFVRNGKHRYNELSGSALSVKAQELNHRIKILTMQGMTVIAFETGVSCSTIHRKPKRIKERTRGMD